MTDDVAIFLDLDNLVIGAKQANLVFDIHLVLEHVKQMTNGRIVLRHAYGAGKQSQPLMQELAQAGFIVQSATRINSFSKNLADMQIVVNAMDTLVDGHTYDTYVIMSGDRDFTPLVQALRKRGKEVIGVGIRDTTSSSLVELCDRYVYYEDLVPSTKWTDEALGNLLERALGELLDQQKRVRASVLKQRMMELSNGTFDNTAYGESSFRKFLERYPDLLRLQQDETTTYVLAAPEEETTKALYLRYRTALKKQRLRVIPPRERFIILRSLISHLQGNPGVRWRDLIAALAEEQEARGEAEISKNMINGVLLLARDASVIRTLKGRSLSTAPVVLELNGERPFQQAIIRCDAKYMQAILDLSEPFDPAEAALAIYDSERYVPYLQQVMNSLDDLHIT